MKRILLILLACAALSACNKSDEVTYDSTIGYLTNTASVKSGIVGTWKTGTHNLTFNADMTCTIKDEGYTYDIVVQNGAYACKLTPNDGRASSVYEVLRLDRTRLVLSNNGVDYSYRRTN